MRNLAVFDLDGTLLNTNHVDTEYYVRSAMDEERAPRESFFRRSAA